MEEKTKLPTKKQSPESRAKSKPDAGKSTEDLSFLAITAMLTADSMGIRQLAGENLTEAAGRIGNRAMLGALDDGERELAAAKQAARRLDAAPVTFLEKSPENAVSPDEAFAPVTVPDFADPGTEPMHFTQAASLAQ